MKHRWVFTITIAVLLLGIGALAIRHQRATALDRQALEAAQRGLSWLLSQQIPLKDPAILWIVSAVDDEYCHDARLHDFVAKRFAEFAKRSHPIYLALRGAALGAREQTYPAFFRSWMMRSDRSDLISAMAYGIYCDRVPLPDSIAKTLFESKLEGYELTHQFVALVYMQEHGCLTTPDQRAQLPRLARAIAAEQAGDPLFSDLSAERVAVLLYADFRELVETAWIEQLLAKQTPTGAWSDPGFPKGFYPSAENPHTTVLALWALSEFSRSCPLPF